MSGLMNRPSCTVSYIRRVGADPDLVLKLTKQKLERRSLKVMFNCAFIVLFFLTSLVCSLYGMYRLSADLSTLSLLLELVDTLVAVIGIGIGVYGVVLSKTTDFKPIERYSRLSLGFGVLYTGLFLCKVAVEGVEGRDSLNLFTDGRTVGALGCYALILVGLGFFVARFVTQVRKFGTDLVQLRAHTIPLLDAVVGAVVSTAGKKKPSQLTL